MTDRMKKCPYCGNDMEQGVIQSPQEISWKRKASIIGRAQFHEGSVVLSELNIFKGSKVRAFLCRHCKKVMIDYSENNADENQGNTFPEREK